jgi:hypothetical protein
VTTKSRKFARLIAAGENKVSAYDQSYADRGGKQSTRRTEACVLSKQPEILAEIEKWEERLIPIGDLKKCKARLLGNIENLAFHAQNEHVRLAASRMLVEYCTEHENREATRFPTAGKASVEEVVEELMRLAAVPGALELEVEHEGEVEPEAAEPDET